MAAPPTRALVVRRRRRRGYDRRKDLTGYVREVFVRHLEAVGGRPSGRILEVGPGGNLATAALFIRHGADRATVIDTEALVHHSDVYRELELDDLLDRVDYQFPVAIEEAGFPNNSFDFIYSHACYEHFSDPAAATHNIARMLKPGGVTSHVIDLRDHRNFSKPLEFLKLSERRWRLASSYRSMPTNRWRAPQLRSAFEDAGLVIERFEVTERAKLNEQIRSSLATPFREMPLDDLSVVGLLLVARKPAGAI